MWKQDLAKLKQQLGEDPLPARPAPAPKPTPITSENRSIEDEDALFLRSMGKPTPARSSAPEWVPQAAAPARVPAPPQEDPEAFRKAMGEMKGVRSLGPGPAAEEPPPPPPPPPAKPAQPSDLMARLQEAAEQTRPLDARAPSPEALKPRGPVLIQLAAGMAIEVDGVLDLRNHTLSDARERLKERVEDAGYLGWRSMHVILGPSEALKHGFLAFLTTPAARPVLRYAQAPIPMGGPQAWIVYLGGIPT